jgi:N-acetylglucosaminyl-diphospho-decaprenol L-rhamnosyltransferase
VNEGRSEERVPARGSPSPSVGSPRFSVAIVTYNNRDEIDACLDSVLAEPEASEVLVVDNASSDGTPEAVSRRAATEPRLRLIRNVSNEGFARACNRALHVASEPLLLLLNPDAALVPGALAALGRGFATHSGAGVLGLKVFDWDGVTVQLSCRSFPGHRTALFNRYSLLTRMLPKNRWSRRYLALDFDHERAAPFDWVSGCAMALRREVLDRIGLLDEDFFMFCEDVDLCLRARKAGFEVLYWPEARARHRIGSSSRSVPRLVVRARHRSMWLYYKKHLRGGPLLDAVTYVGIRARCLWQGLWAR